jgi:hypothetical protein
VTGTRRSADATPALAISVTSQREQVPTGKPATPRLRRGEGSVIERRIIEHVFDK